MLHVLVVEDNEADALAVRRALSRVKIAHVLVEARDAESALELIGSETMRLSELMLLVDVNLPKKSGLSLIRELRTHDLLRHVPVVVLSGSEREEDLQVAQELNVSGYFLKPKTTEELAMLIETIVRYWSSSGLAPLPRTLSRSG